MLGKLLRSLSGRRPVDREVEPSPVPATVTQPREDDPPVTVPGLPFMLRPLEEQDLPRLADLFQHAVHELASRDYSQEQRQAWAATARDDGFAAGLREGVTIVADNDGTPVAFAQLHPSDHLRMLYVDPEWAGLGIPMLLYQYLEDEARILGSKTLSTHASRTAQRFFKGMGFTDDGEEEVERNGVILPRHAMSKVLVK